ncbi:MAG: hypothetical protein J5529_09080 [Prevotella sp.]|nr:hypothetical protein [Prevotella sp.]
MAKEKMNNWKKESSYHTKLFLFKFRKLMNILHINGLKGQRALSPGQRPEYRTRPTIALKRQKNDGDDKAYAPALATQYNPGRCPGL